MSDRRIRSVRDLVAEGVLERPLDGNHGELHPKSADFTKSGIPFVMASDLINGRLNLETCHFIDPRQAQSLRKGFARNGDVLLSHKATIGRTAIVADIPTDFIVLTPQVTYYRIVDKQRLDAKYLRYYFDSRQFQDALNARSGGGSTRAYIGITEQLSLPISLCPISEQRTIASTLSALDDKIELNRKMSATLEAIARALFKSWFVDFDPVRAKAEGRDPRLPAEIATLFPDSFEETAHGQIPSGWRVGALGDVISQRVDRCDESEETASKPYVPIDCISSKSLLLDAVKPGYEAKSSLTRFYKYDILFGAMRPYFHKVCVAPFDGITRTTVFTLHPRERADFAFVTLLLHDDRTIDYATAHSTGTTIPYAVWRNSLERMQTVIPPPRLRETFGEVVGPNLQRIAEVFSESQTLSQLLNTLLPKLISGELRVGEAERVLAASA